MSEFDVASTIGSAGDLGIEFGAIEIDLLNFDEAAVRLNTLAGYISAVDIPMRGAKRIAMDDMKQRFDDEVSPDGAKWFALDPDYAARKQHEVGFEHPILTRERELRDAATSEEAWSVTGESLFFNTSVLPEYWRVHQEGSIGFGAKFHASANIAGEADVEGEQNIPPRPYIGLSAEAEAKIFTLFDVWFSEGIEMATKRFAISSVGTLQARSPRGGFGRAIPLD